MKKTATYREIEKLKSWGRERSYRSEFTNYAPNTAWNFKIITGRYKKDKKLYSKFKVLTYNSIKRLYKKYGNRKFKIASNEIKIEQYGRTHYSVYINNEHFILAGHRV